MQTANLSTSRQAYLDWLRTMAIIGVLVFHAAMAFVAEWGWHIKNPETSHLLLEFNFWLSSFRMPLLFFISGAVSYYMLQKKSAGGFIGLRFRRLLVPLLFGMFIIVPPQIYMERLTQGFRGSFVDFYPSILQFVPYPKGNFSWHHLWFILYLFVYDLAFAPVFKWLVSEKGKRFMQKMNWMARSRWIYLLVIPGVLVLTSLNFTFPETNDFIHDWCRLPYWLLFVLGGFFCIANPAFSDSLERNRRSSLLLAFLTIVAINYIRWNKLEPWDHIANWRSDWRTYAYMSLYALTAWFWVLAAVGYGKKYLNKKHRVQNYVNQAVYPFYILHQTVIVIIVYYVVQVKESIAMKYFFTVILSFLVSMAIYHLLIRPFNLMRFLFGMKPKAEVTGYQAQGTKAKLPAYTETPVNKENTGIKVPAYAEVSVNKYRD